MSALSDDNVFKICGTIIAALLGALWYQLNLKVNNTVSKDVFDVHAHHWNASFMRIEKAMGILPRDPKDKD
jgi:hypothetical protein